MKSYKKRSNATRQKLLVGVFFISFHAFAANNQFVRPLPGGFIFPMFNEAALINASTLNVKNQAAVQGIISPPISPSNSTAVEGSVAMSKGSYGIGAGYQESVTNSSVPDQASNGLFAGAAAGTKSVSVGATIRSVFLNSGPIQPKVDVDVLFGGDSKVNFGVAAYAINTNTIQPAIGVGYRNGRNYSLETDILFPGLNQIGVSGSTYNWTVAGTVYAGIFGFSFAAIHPYVLGGGTSGFALSYNVGLLVDITKRLNVVFFYNAANVISCGLTFIL